MKLTKKIASFLLALVMVFSVATTVLAANENPHTITIANSTSGYEYEAYQIFKGDLADNVLANVEWGKNIDISKLADAFKDTTFDGMTDAADVVAKLDGAGDESPVAKEFAAVIAKCLTGDPSVSTYKDGKYTIDVVGDGYYLVKNTKVPEVTEQTPEGSYTRYILKVVGDVTVQHKGDVPSVDKDILDPDEVDVNEASIGDTVKYQFTGTLPSNIEDYEAYYYTFTDTLSKGLTYTDGSVKVTIEGVDVTEHFEVSDSEDSETTGTTIKVGIANLLALENLVDENGDQLINIAASTEVIVTYEAVLNENAVINGDGNPNDVKLEYSNDPNDSSVHGETPKSVVITYVTELTIEKVDGAGKILTGAAFRIEGDGVNIVITTGEVYIVDNENGTYWKLKDGTYTTTDPAGEDIDTSVYEDINTKYSKATKTTIDTSSEGVNAEGFVDENGKLTFTGLGAGEYTITEIVTPAGYNTIAPFTIKIEFDVETGTFTFTRGEAEASDTIQVVNEAGAQLPETGGMGTTIFYIVGGLLVVAAVVLLVTKKRMNVA